MKHKSKLKRILNTKSIKITTFVCIIAMLASVVGAWPSLGHATVPEQPYYEELAIENEAPPLAEEELAAEPYEEKLSSEEIEPLEFMGFEPFGTGTQETITITAPAGLNLATTTWEFVSSHHASTTLTSPGASTTVTIASAETNVEIVIRATGANGVTSDMVISLGNPEEFRLTTAAPAAPTLATGGATATSITLNVITAPAGWVTEYRVGTGAWQESTTFSGLTAGTSHAFSARFLAVNAETHVTTAAGATASFNTLQHTTDTPTAPVATSITSTGFTMGHTPATVPAGWTAQWRWQVGTGAWTETTTAAVTGRASGTAHNYQVRFVATNTTTHATTAWSASRAVTTTATAAIAAPTGLSTTAITTSGWTANTSQAHQAGYVFEIEWRVGSAGTATSVAATGTNRTVAVTGRTAGTAHTWRARWQSTNTTERAHGSWSAWQNVTTLTPVGSTFEDNGITWRVLHVDNQGRQLIITEHVHGLGTRYHHTNTFVQLHNAEIRTALNTWYSNNTSAALRASAIPFTPAQLRSTRTAIGNWNANEVDPAHHAMPGTGTAAANGSNALFLLSLSEVNTYFGMNSTHWSAAMATCPAGTARAWWLRSPGHCTTSTVSLVSSVGNRNFWDATHSHSYIGFRPALWINP